jgi:uncharacterized protein YecA (UPF0149 family)
MSVSQIAHEQAVGVRPEAPAQIVEMYAAADARRGRNDPCACGSGKKWKRCHGAETVGPLR